MDTGDIARLLNLSREYVTGKLTKKPGFPKPAINASQKLRRWREADVMAYLTGKGQRRAAMDSVDSR